MKASKETPFSVVSVGQLHTCGLTKEKAEIKCWGGDREKQVRGMTALPKGKCGHGKRSYCAGLPATTKFSAVSAGDRHTCGITKEPIAVVCWGENTDNQAAVPGTIKWAEEKSCQSAHEEISGPASCTSCDPKGCNKHFTIMDPATNTGTCTAKPCPMCKPSTCCTPGHKHYVINTDNMEGVCVRHTDDCSTVCMPRGNVHPEKRRVCSKGCNKKLKVPKSAVASGAATDAELFDIVVCQVEWRIVCEKGACKTTKGVEPIARCSFTSAVWNSGATCIANHVQKDKHPKCPEKLAAKAAENMKRAGCRNATFTKATTAQQLQKLGDDTDVGACKKLADALAEYY
jgi:hypothetical protein